MKTLFALLLSVVLNSTAVSAAPKTILISDVDDTIKVAYSFGIARGIQYLRDTETRFAGMSELYMLLSRDSGNFRVYYVSMAPTFLMEKIHLQFLNNGRFPEGPYIGRSAYPAETHKLESIRALLRQEKPEKVVMIGDDGQSDAEIYHAISQDPEFAGMTFDQFIHIVSSGVDEKGRGKVHDEQVGYVTPVELAVELNRRGLLEEKSLTYVMNVLLPRILAEKPEANDGAVETTFPYFMDCRALEWRWDIPGLNERVKKSCRLP